MFELVQGIGQSADSSGIVNYTLKDYADSTSDFVEALGLGAPDVYGNSLGGAITLTTALLYPALFRRLVLSDTGPGGSGEQSSPASDVSRYLAA